MVSEVETNMVGVERIKEYQEIEEEAPLEIPEQDPPKEWPAYGVVKFDNYQTRYRAGLDLVLKGKIAISMEKSILWKETYISRQFNESEVLHNTEIT